MYRTATGTSQPLARPRTATGETQATVTVAILQQPFRQTTNQRGLSQVTNGVNSTRLRQTNPTTRVLRVYTPKLPLRLRLRLQLRKEINTAED